MIPRTLVPPDARPTNLVVTKGRPTALDERTLIPGTITTGPLEEKSQIPAGLPLDSISARVVVPRDAKILPYIAPEIGDVTAQPSAMDQRIAVPLGAMPPENFADAFTRPENLVEGDVFTTGEVQLLVTPVDRAKKTREELTNRITTAVVYVLILIALRITPGFHKQKLRTDSDELARKNVTLLLPPGPLDIPAPARPPQPRIQVNPNVLRKIAPPALPAPIPQPQPEVQPQPKQDLPSAPAPQTNATQPAPQPKTEVASNNPLKLEIPDTPKPQPGLILPKYGNTRPTDAAPHRDSSGISGPRGTIQSVPLPRSAGGGGSGQAAAGMTMLTPDQGVDFSVYLARVRASIERNWQAVMPESVMLGERGKVVLQFRIMKDGSVPAGYPMLVRTSAKEPLDRAAVSSIRASNPFGPLPSAFSGPYIDLLVTYLYNLPLEAANEQ
jgi:outer membrane biosynthesis protein TonB